MLIALVGPTGVLGRALVPLLLAAGHRPRLLARSPEKARGMFPAGVEIAACDLLAPGIDARLPGLLEGCAALAHIATAIPRDGTRPGAWDANTRLRTDGVRALIAGARAAGVPYYVQQSITMAYPDGGEQWIDESMPLAATGGVRGPVAAMEAQVREIPAGTMQWAILRCGNFVGPDTAQDGVIERLRARTQHVPGDGSNWVSLVHVADAAAGFAAALERAPAAAILHICAEPLRNGEYLDRLADAVGAARAARDPSAALPPSWRCSNRAAREQLGWTPRQSLFPS